MPEPEPQAPASASTAPAPAAEDATLQSVSEPLGAGDSAEAAEQPADVGLGDGDDEGDAEAVGDDESDADAAPPEHLPTLLESLLFVSDGPVEERVLARVVGVRLPVVRAALDELRQRLEGSGVRLQSGPDGAQLVTAPESAAYVEGFLGLEHGRRLSNAALEVLAIVAYRQPVTRATVEAIRGVSSDGAVQTLRARGLIEEGGRAPGPGRPALFVTTQRFLEHFGLEGALELPELGDYDLPPPDAPQPMRFDETNQTDEPRVEDVVAERLARLARAAARSMRPGAEWPRRRAVERQGAPAAASVSLPGSRISPPAGRPSQLPRVQRPTL